MSSTGFYDVSTDAHEQAQVQLKSMRLLGNNSAISARQHALYRSNKYLLLTILVTEQCNFRCQYCYQDFQDTYLSDEVYGGLQAFICRQVEAGLKVLNICWFGGEPTLHLKPILALGTWIKSQFPDLVFSASMSTNAFLLNAKLFKLLFQAGTRHYQISLDGLHSTHDELRTRRNHGGSFQKIWTNLLLLKQLEEDYSIDLRLHVHALNQAQFLTFYEVVSSTFGDDPRFQINVEKIKDLGGNQKVHNLTPNEEVAPSTSHTGVCYAAMPRQLLIYPDGRLGKCTVRLNDKANIVGQLHPNGAVTLLNKQLASWTQGFATLDPQALSCPAKKVSSKRQEHDERNVIPIVQLGESHG